jgi:hypothetical protein
MPHKNRESFIALLHKLGHPEDKDALAAAREIAQRVKDAGADWAALLSPTGVVHAQLHEDDDGGAGGGVHAGGEFAGVSGAAPGDTAADLAAIERLIAQHQLSADTKQMLEDLKQDIQEGEFTAVDRRYLESLEARLGGGRK